MSIASFVIVDIGGSRIFVEGFFRNPSEISDRALRGSELTGE